MNNSQEYFSLCAVKSKISNIKLVDRLNDRKKNLCQQLLYIGLIMFSSSAFAGARQSPIEAALEDVIDWLTGPLGLSAGTLAIIGAGFAGLTGRMPMAYLKTIGISLGVMYSAAFLASLVTGQ